MNTIMVNNKKIYHFSSKQELINFVKNKKTILISANAEAIMKNDDRFTNIINNNIAYADGIGAVMALKSKGFKEAIKIPGVELWINVLQNSIGKKVYFLGASKEVIEKTVQKAKLEFPNISIVGYRDGYFKDSDFNNIKTEILSKKPDIVLIALGQPRQEYIAEELLNLHPALYMGLGGSFDIYSGVKQRAPKFFLDNGLEWLYRLLKEPTRIKRQLGLFNFLVLLKLNKI